jgi:hypothetical protein
MATITLNHTTPARQDGLNRVFARILPPTADESLCPGARTKP